MKIIVRKNTEINTNDDINIDDNFKRSVIFPYGYNRNANYGFSEADIMEIREILQKEIKRQNEEEAKQKNE